MDGRSSKSIPSGNKREREKNVDERGAGHWWLLIYNIHRTGVVERRRSCSIFKFARLPSGANLVYSRKIDRLSKITWPSIAPAAPRIRCTARYPNKTSARAKKTQSNNQKKQQTNVREEWMKGDEAAPSLIR